MTDEERKEKRIRNYYDEVTPLVLQFMRLVRTYGMTDMAEIVVDPSNGYIRCHLHESTIDMYRVTEDSEFKINNFAAED